MTVSSLTAFPTNKSLHRLHRLVMFAKVPHKYFTFIFHFQFSLTVSLISLTFLGIPVLVCLNFLLPFLHWKEFSFSLFLSPHLLLDSLFTSPAQKARSSGNRKTCSSLFQELAKPDQERIVNYWFESPFSSEERETREKCCWSGMKAAYGRVQKKQLLFISA